jgi:hypothetical protein
MRKLITAAILAVLGWQGYNAYRRASLASEEPSAEITEDSAAFREDSAEFARGGADEGRDEPVSDDSRFTCDGRTHCSQMTSCEEATWFINHCPGTKMDGNNDGVPCESQWCGR